MPDSIFEDKDQYLIVPWPDCQIFLGYRDRIFLAIENAYDAFGDSAHFVPLDLFARHTSYVPNDPEFIFIKVDLTNKLSVRLSHAHLLYQVYDYTNAIDASNNVYFISLKNVEFFNYQRSKISMNIPKISP